MTHNLLVCTMDEIFLLKLRKPFLRAQNSDELCEYTLKGTCQVCYVLSQAQRFHNFYSILLLCKVSGMAQFREDERLTLPQSWYIRGCSHVVGGSLTVLGKRNEIKVGGGGG